MTITGLKDCRYAWTLLANYWSSRRILRGAYCMSCLGVFRENNTQRKRREIRVNKGGGVETVKEMLVIDKHLLSVHTYSALTYSFKAR
jgi:hypothetical protein